MNLLLLTHLWPGILKKVKQLVLGKDLNISSINKNVWFERVQLKLWISCRHRYIYVATIRSIVP